MYSFDLVTPYSPGSGGSLSPHFDMVFHDFSCSGYSLWPVTSLTLLHTHWGSSDTSLLTISQISMPSWLGFCFSLFWNLSPLLSLLPLLYLPYFHTSSPLLLSCFFFFFKNTQNKSNDCFPHLLSQHIYLYHHSHLSELSSVSTYTP